MDCTICKGKKTVFVKDRPIPGQPPPVEETGHEETCPHCKGTGVEPEVDFERP